MSDLDINLLVQSISCILEDVICDRDHCCCPLSVSRFTALYKPDICIHDYIERLYKYSHCSPECLVLSLIYIDRLIQSGRIEVNSLSIHRVLITSIMLAAKFFDDAFFTNDCYAFIGGISVEELNLLEVDYISAINYTLYVSTSDYNHYVQMLYTHAMSTMGHNYCIQFDSKWLFIGDVYSVIKEENSEDHSVLYCEQSKRVNNDSPCNIAFNMYDN